ncbi:MAG TPA: hypothetical protein VER32_01905 [Pyrinomonadaceae bacterium]|nr:hypothetical protein [Pyrinomonadaceae bacterium]
MATTKKSAKKKPAKKASPAAKKGAGAKKPAKRPAAAKSATKATAAKSAKAAAKSQKGAAKKAVAKSQGAASKSQKIAVKSQKVAAKSRAAAASKASKSSAAKAAKRRASDPAEVLREFAASEARGHASEYETLLCLACIFDLFTKQLGLAPRTAYSEIKRYTPPVEELTARTPSRPYFDSEGRNPRCPYCDSAKRWHARVTTHRVESSAVSPAATRALLAKLPKSEEQFTTVERKATAQAVFYEWLDELRARLDFEDDRAWMTEAARAYLERREPKTDWAEVFRTARAVRRSQRLSEGWEQDGGRVFLAPPLYSDILLVQYLVSRSHRHGGRTFEGRLTLLELVRRMRHSGHLDAQGITERDQFEVLEKLVEGLTGGGRPVKLLYVIDLRDLRDKVRDVYARYAA